MKGKVNKKLLIFSAHPDDHLSCAGAAMYLKSIGFSITEVVFTNGENSVNKLAPNTIVNKTELEKTRKAEFKKASQIMGTDKTVFLGLPNGGILKSSELLAKIIAMIRNEKPLVVICENIADYHSDHKIVGQIVTEATIKAGWGVQKELGESYKASLGLYMGTKLENEKIDLLFDVTNFWTKKLKMLEAYGSQMGSYGFQLNEALGKYCGYLLRVPYAESFQLMEGFPIKCNTLIDKMVGDCDGKEEQYTSK